MVCIYNFIELKQTYGSKYQTWMIPLNQTKGSIFLPFACGKGGGEGTATAVTLFTDSYDVLSELPGSNFGY